MLWKTRLTELLGSKYPIMSGAYGGFGKSDLAAPVSEAGGFGIITCYAFRTAEQLREDIRKAKSMTQKPFGVNFSGPADNPKFDDMFKVCLDEGIEVYETAGFGCDGYAKKLKPAGVKWIHKVTTVKHAVHAEHCGVDAVIIVGLEGAGFKSVLMLPTLTSISWAKKKLSIPIIAAGAIGDSRTFLGALALGAEGVYMGTAFMLTRECPISDSYKQRMLDSDPSDPEFRGHVLNPPNLEAYNKILKERGTIPEHIWMRRLARVFSGVDPDMPDALTDESVEETMKHRQVSLAVAVMEGKMMTAKELIDGIIGGAEEVLKGGIFAAARSR